MSFLEKLKSRKLWVALIGLVLFVLHDLVGLDFDLETTIGLLGTVIAYIFGEGFVDAKRAAAEIKSESSYWQSQANDAYARFYELQDRISATQNQAESTIDNAAPRDW